MTESEFFDGDDPFYGLPSIADESGESLDNDQMDEIVYGQWDAGDRTCSKASR